MEITEKELNNIMGGIPNEIVDEIVLENKELYRQEQIEELKNQRDFLITMKNMEQTENIEETQIPKF